MMMAQSSAFDRARQTPISAIGPLRRQLKAQSTLLIELLRSRHVQRILGHALSHSIARHVSQRSVLPCVRNSKEQPAVATHENILRNVFGSRRGNGGGCARGWI